MRLISLLLFLSVLILSVLQFSSIAELQDIQLIQSLETQLLDEYREKSADKLNQSFESDSLGKILHRAADIFTTRITLVSTRKSQSLFPGNTPPVIIIYARFLVENTSEEPLQASRYLRFSPLPDGNWQYTGDSEATDFYLNYLKIR